MIRSMTAFTRREIKCNWGRAVLELRSLNQRYLHLSIFLSEQFRDLEKNIRERICCRLTRGKVEFNLRCYLNPTIKNTVFFNKKFAQQIIKSIALLKRHSSKTKTDIMSILCYPGVMLHAEEQGFEFIRADLLSAVDVTIEDFIRTREDEGSVLCELIKQRLTSIKAVLLKIYEKIMEILDWERNRFINKILSLNMQLKSDSLEKEIVKMAYTTDFLEEMNRLNYYLKLTYFILNQKGAIGRYLDFVFQEFSRTVNSLALIFISPIIAKRLIELKILIEQIREQAKNLE
ncbi:TIGR00255 family protein [secondary endosymbiont of Heteropsylla cubana]|uniref:TIGR00255 family protein n=1 Tax=secondary endosymbiont of Heteropsylla cubana TaxID=134287 RepID=J3TG77_9ENTR|nr:YicC/YloC family endoribonuclease [secondary endosymbiont of Heteropsylla cubana]AFP85362.1 TIGR00255 family protein [secondary endosymbiont of Heteropsylla cubana]